MNEGQEKSADNAIFESRESVRYLEDAIYGQQQNLKNLDEMEETFLTLKKQINKCVDLLNRSMKGKNINSRLSEIEGNNNRLYDNRLEMIREKRKETKETISRLTQEKEDYLDKIKEEYKKEEAKGNDL